MESYFKFNNPYNVIATLILKLKEKDENSFMDSSRRKSLVIPDNLAKEIENVFDKYNLDNSKTILEDGFSDDAERFLLGFFEENDFICGFEFLLRLTRTLNWKRIIKSSYVDELKSQGGFKGLNTNGDDMGIWIVPKVPSWDSASLLFSDSPTEVKSRWVTERLAGINDDLANIYYVDTKEMHFGSIKYIPNNIIVDDIVKLSDKKIRVAFSPITNKECVDPIFYDDDDQHKFSCNELKEQEYIKERVNKIYLEACHRKANILFFPEMLGLPEMNNEDPFNDAANEAIDNEWASPQLVLTPSIWNDFINKVNVISGGGQILCAQSKQFSFSYKKGGTEYFEDLRNGLPIINVIHIPYVGRLTLPICIDLLTPQYMEILVGTLRSSFIICPSYSFGKTLFNFESMHSLSYGCITIWGNSCAAGYKETDSENYIGVVSAPVKNGESSVRFTPKCNKDCDSKDNCIFLIDIHFGDEIYVEVDHVC